MINFSIIIPHKNSTELLSRLLDSIPDVDDIEIIVVDNNSTDEEKSKISRLDKKKNLTIYSDDSGLGAGKARNIGIEKAKGRWLIFADADDNFSSNMYEIINRQKDNTADIVYFDTYSIYSDSEEEAYRHQRYSNLVHNYLQNEEEDALRYYFTPPWAKMIKRDLVVNNKLRFDEVIASNDIYFSITTAHAAQKITAINDILYIISVTAGSLTNSFSKIHFDTRLNVALKANDFLKGIKKNKYQQSILYFIVKSYKFGLFYMINVLSKLIKHRSNIFIGFSKILNYKSVLRERENPKYLKKNE